MHHPFPWKCCIMCYSSVLHYEYTIHSMVRWLIQSGGVSTVAMAISVAGVMCFFVDGVIVVDLMIDVILLLFLSLFLSMSLLVMGMLLLAFFFIVIGRVVNFPLGVVVASDACIRFVDGNVIIGGVVPRVLLSTWLLVFLWVLLLWSSRRPLCN